MKRDTETLVDVVQRWSEARPSARAFTYLVDGEREEQTLTFAELDARSRATAAMLQAHSAPGARALLVLPAGLDYVSTVLGCLYASVVPVPVAPSRRAEGVAKLEAIASDCEPVLALTTSRLGQDLSTRFANATALGSLHWLDADVPLEEATRFRPRALRPDDPALLQYTSGATGDPKGVLVTHANLMHNERAIAAALETEGEATGVSWLPAYHDMGLIGNVLQGLFVGGHCVLMSPHAFLQRPLRWLEAISRYRASSSGGPSFAYDLVLSKVTEEQKRALDLSSWTLAYVGADPIRAETLDRFARGFEICGFREKAFYPCYGLAESTLFVSGGRRSARPTVREIDAEALERREAVPALPGDPRARALVGCGRPPADTRVVVTDPETLEPLVEGEVGEIWVSGPSVARGYWGRPRETTSAFQARLESNDAPFLRTGDLGFLMEGELFVTGRRADLVHLGGRDHYPHHIERSVEACHAALRPEASAAFAIPFGGEERLVIVCEIERRRDRSEGLEDVVETVRAAVRTEHAIEPHAVVLIRPGTLARTSSGKVRRHRCRELFLSGHLQMIAEWAELAPPRSFVVTA